MIVAHRGASRDAPENTLRAFQLAWQQGADAIEGDFHLTSDGFIVCMHDANTARVTGTELSVKDSGLAQLRALDAGAGSGKDFEGTIIPTIAEVFATVPKGKKVFVEIKCGCEIFPPLLEEIRRSGLADDQITVICFNKEVIKCIKSEEPRFKAYWLCSFEKQPTGEVTPSAAKVLDTLKLIGADGLSSNTAIPESIIQAVREKGYEWHVWTVDDPETAIRMHELGASSITTNVPGTIRQHLNEQSTAAGASKGNRDR